MENRLLKRLKQLFIYIAVQMIKIFPTIPLIHLVGSLDMTLRTLYEKGSSNMPGLKDAAMLSTM